MADTNSEFKHQPVMLDEIVEVFATVPAGTLVDGTVGGGGHAFALLERHDHLRVVGIDRDRAAVEAARARLAPFGDRAEVVQQRFDRLAEVVATLQLGPLSGVLLDLGVSSPQLDWADRGFSHRRDAPLDMRMDRRQPLTAAHVVNDYAEGDLIRVLRRNADESHAPRIVRAIAASRPIHTTAELAEVVRDAIPAPARRRGGHPAARTFQAIRIEVNGELEMLPRAVDAAIAATGPRGRIAVLSYHSGEDRIVKDRFRQAERGGCTCPPKLPCGCGAVASAKLVFRGSHTPSGAELAANPRCASARLRVVEKLTLEPTAGRTP